MQREEKQLEASVEALIQRVLELKNSITALLVKLETEYESLHWPTILDNFALISSNVSSLNRLLKNDKCPAFRNYALLPLVLSPDRDQDLEKVTEGRVFAFNHEVVPDYLRTKPEPEVEERVNTLQNRVNTLSTETLNKQMNQLNKVTNNMIEAINNARDEWETDITKSQQPPTSSMADTNLLVAAVSFGKSLKNKRPDAMPVQPPQGQMGQPPEQMQPRGPTPNVHINKAPSTIKTNIRSGGSAMHPYQRP